MTTEDDVKTMELLDDLRRDTERSARLTLGCVLTLSVVELLQRGMPLADVHNIVDLTATYGVPEEKTVSTVWVYLLAYAVRGFSNVGVGLQEVHQAVDMSGHAVAGAQP